MEALRKFIVALFAIALSITISVLVMIKGWGLEPKSWGWILGVSFFGQLLAQLMIVIAKSDKSDKADE